MDFSFKDANRLWSLVRRQEALVDKKRRWLESMIPKQDGCIRRAKRPKFLSDSYLAESDVRSGEVSCEKVKASVAKSFSLQWDGYSHHLVEDGVRLFNLQKEGNGSLSPETLNIMHSTISKLSSEALQSVASIISHNKYSFHKNSRPVMRKIIMDNLPSYLAKLDDEDTIMSQLSEIFKNPCSYQSNSLGLVTVVTPLFLSSINQALDRLDGIPEQVLVAMNRKLLEKPCSPKFWHVPRCSRREDLIEMVRKKCKNIIAQLDEGHYLPKKFNKLAKAMSVMNLYHKQKLRCMDISQLEFFPFPTEIISLQNDVLNALWSLPKIKQDELKLLRPILDQDFKVRKKKFKVGLRSYLIECLFECDRGILPDKALRAIAFINRISRCDKVALRERMDAEVEAILNVSTHLKSLAYYGTDECSDDEELVSSGSDNCSEDNDFILLDTNYFQHKSEQQMDEPCCSSNTPENADMDKCCSSETFKATQSVSGAGDLNSKLVEDSRKPRGRTKDSGCEEALEKAIDISHSKALTPSKNLSEICDETSTAVHMLIGEVLDRWLLMDNVEVDELTRHYIGGGLVSHGHQDAPGLPTVAEEKNLKSDILVHTVEHIFPTLSKSCIEKVKRLMS